MEGGECDAEVGGGESQISDFKLKPAICDSTVILRLKSFIAYSL